MSIDTEVWVSSLDSVGPSLARVSPRWVEADGEWSSERTGWQLLVFEPEEADPADAGADLEPALGDRSFRIGLTLEPIGAPAEAEKLLRETIRALVDDLDGMALDPSTGDIISR